MCPDPRGACVCRGDGVEAGHRLNPPRRQRKSRTFLMTHRDRSITSGVPLDDAAPGRGGRPKEFLMLIRLACTLRASLRSDDRGATAVEYGLMVALIAVVIIGAVILLGDNLSDMFGGVADQVE